MLLENKSTGKRKRLKNSPIISVAFESLFPLGRYYSERKEPPPLEVIQRAGGGIKKQRPGTRNAKTFFNQLPRRINTPRNKPRSGLFSHRFFLFCSCSYQLSLCFLSLFGLFAVLSIGWVPSCLLQAIFCLFPFSSFFPLNGACGWFPG